MQNSNVAKALWKYLLILAVLSTTGIGLLIGKEFNPTSLDSRSKTPAQVQTEAGNLQPPIIAGTIDPCAALYLSLPPKCKTFDGEYIPVPGNSLYIVVTPEGK